MVQLNKDGSRDNVSIEEWIADTDDDIKDIPSSAPFGSFVLVLKSAEANGKMAVKIKDSSGGWVLA